MRYTTSPSVANGSSSVQPRLHQPDMPFPPLHPRPRTNLSCSSHRTSSAHPLIRRASTFTHLLPAISTLPTSPLSCVRDWLSVIRMHQEYNSERTAEARREAIADAQKRRLYRRAHGMEDLEKDVQGVDVKGLVSWD